MLSVFIEYSIDCAHFLPNVPRGHKCGNMHGHRYDIRLEVSGDIDPSRGWIMDYDEIKKFTDPIILGLDHRELNSFTSLRNPTCENMVDFLVTSISACLPGLSLVEVRETSRAGCVWRRR